MCVGDIWFPGCVCLLPGAQPIVKHDAGAAERLPERGPVARARVQAVVVPELHTEIIFEFMAKCREIRS